MSARDRVASEVVKALVALPGPAQRVITGAPVRIDGQELDREVQLLLRLIDLVPEPELEELTVGEARATRLRAARAFEGPKVPVARVEDIQISGAAGQLDARLYVPHAPERPTPLLVYLHGGGWVIGDLDTHDNVCRFLAREAGVSVLSVDYRLAPEHPFPAAADDALAAFRFAVANAAELGADPEAIAVGGDSAGGNLTAVVSQLAAADGGPVPAFLLMFYPVTDLSKKSPSYRLFPEGFYLTEADMDWFRGHYLPDEECAADPKASPLLAEDLSGLAPAYVATAGFDVLRDEGEEYVRRLRAAGIPVAHRRHEGLIHGFVNALGIGHFTRSALLEATGALRVGLTGAHSRLPLG
jgi:acetyl esterase